MIAELPATVGQATPSMSAHSNTILNVSFPMRNNPAVENSPCSQSYDSASQDNDTAWYPATEVSEIDPYVINEMLSAAHLIEEEQGKTVRGDENYF